MSPHDYEDDYEDEDGDDVNSVPDDYEPVEDDGEYMGGYSNDCVRGMIADMIYRGGDWR